MGFGNFSSFGETDMMLRNVNTGGVEVYDISNNQITGATFMGTVGLNWQFRRLRQFHQPRHQRHAPAQHQDRRLGGLRHRQQSRSPTRPSWARSGSIGRSPASAISAAIAGETDLLLRNTKTGGLEVYDITNNQITGAAFLGTVGIGLAVRGHRPDPRRRRVRPGACATSIPARSRSTTSPTINSPAPRALGQVGLDWQLGGFAADPPTASGAFAGRLERLSSCKRWRALAAAAAQPIA